MLGWHDLILCRSRSVILWLEKKSMLRLMFNWLVYKRHGLSFMLLIERCSVQCHPDDAEVEELVGEYKKYVPWEPVPVVAASEYHY